MSFAKWALSLFYTAKLYRAGKGSYKHMDLRLRPILNCYFTSVFQNFCRATTFFFYFGVLLFSLLWNPSLKIISDMGPSWRGIRRQGREKNSSLWRSLRRNKTRCEVGRWTKWMSSQLDPILPGDCCCADTFWQCDYKKWLWWCTLKWRCCLSSVISGCKKIRKSPTERDQPTAKRSRKLAKRQLSTLLGVSEKDKQLLTEQLTKAQDIVKKLRTENLSLRPGSYVTFLLCRMQLRQ